MGIFRTRKQVVMLRATDLEGLKKELEQILSDAMNKQPADKTFYATKVPMSCSAIVDPGCKFTQQFAFSIPGVLADFTTMTALKDVVVGVKIITPEGTQVITRNIPAGHLKHDFKIQVKPFTVVVFDLNGPVNKDNLASSISIAFTFQERPADETGTTELLGTF